MMPIPVSVLVMTRNEAPRLNASLAALHRFAEIVVVDSGSTDGTADLAVAAGARAVHFSWNGAYPKKRQWCLDHLRLAHDWIFFVDADEIVTPALADEIAALFAPGPPPLAGYFVRGRYVLDARVLRHGIANNKLTLFDRRSVHFPVVGDLAFPGMDEIEGHYQPVARGPNTRFGQMRAPLLHHAYDGGDWLARHRRYAAWEAAMNAKDAWPRDPVFWRQSLKTIFRAMPGRGMAAFLHSYVLKSGWRDGAAGFRVARDRQRYYALIRASALSGGGGASPRSRQ